MPGANAIDLDGYRHEADRFLAELDEEYYRNFAGLKETLDLKPIYERHASLTTLDACQALGAEAEGGSRGVSELWKFACQGHLSELTRTEEEEIANLESSLEAEIDDERIPFRMLRPVIANEPDREKRRRLDAARVDMTERHLIPLSLRAEEKTRAGVADLGSESYLDLHRRFGMPLDALADQCRAYLDSTEDLYVDEIDGLLRRRVGVGLDEAERWDLARLFRAVDWDDRFPANRMLPALEATLADLGIDLRAQSNVHLDLEERPNKTPRAFCAPIEVPGRVMLVIRPMGGPDDWHALFHEAGHTEHFAHTSPRLPVEARRLGDNSVTEAYATLFELLVAERAWLSRRLDFGGIDDFIREHAATELYITRRYCSKILYELELHAATDVEPLRERYVELLGDATKIEPAGADYLADVDQGFYVSCYLRSWAVEALLRAHLREQFGNAWFAHREAGDLLKELWLEGQAWDADTLLAEVTGTTLDLDAVRERILEGLG